MPHILREEVLKKVLENTQDLTSEISDNANDKPNIQESKITPTRLKTKAKIEITLKSVFHSSL